MGNKIVYVGSFNPAHNAHKNTWKKAEDYFGEPVSIGVCNNELKTKEFFSLEERLEFAYLIFGQEADISIYEKYDDIRRLLYESKAVVRGYRDIRDYLYCWRLARYYKVTDLQSKVAFMPVDLEFRYISSSKIKRELFSEKPDLEMLSTALGEEGSAKILTLKKSN